ncbi:MAG: GspMb/PilO family protein [Candidatus Omnitrophota bacterium]
MISKFISGLSVNERKILVFASLLGLLAVFDRLLLGPSLGRIRELDDSIVKEEDTVRRNLRFLGYKDRIVGEASAFRSFYTLEARSEDEIIADFLKKMEIMGSQAQITLSKIATAGQEAQKDYIKYFVTMDCSGKLESLTSFIYAINNAQELIKVEKMSFSGNARNAEAIQATLTVSKMIVGADPSVEAKSLVRAKEQAKAEVKTGAEK